MRYCCHHVFLLRVGGGGGVGPAVSDLSGATAALRVIQNADRTLVPKP